MSNSKYQEALKFFRVLPHRIPLRFANDEFCKKYDKNFALIKELVDKATPKNPILVTHGKVKMTAKEMFEESGLHEQTQTIFKDWIIYGSVFSGQVVFDTSYQTINLNMTITPELHKAIGVKMKELGWI